MVSRNARDKEDGPCDKGYLKYNKARVEVTRISPTGRTGGTGSVVGKWHEPNQGVSGTESEGGQRVPTRVLNHVSTVNRHQTTY